MDRSAEMVSATRTWTAPLAFVVTQPSNHARPSNAVIFQPLPAVCTKWNVEQPSTCPSLQSCVMYIARIRCLLFWLSGCVETPPDDVLNYASCLLMNPVPIEATGNDDPHLGLKSVYAGNCTEEGNVWTHPWVVIQTEHSSSKPPAAKRKTSPGYWLRCASVEVHGSGQNTHATLLMKLLPESQVASQHIPIATVKWRESTGCFRCTNQGTREVPNDADYTLSGVVDLCSRGNHCFGRKSPIDRRLPTTMGIRHLGRHLHHAQWPIACATAPDQLHDAGRAYLSSDRRSKAGCWRYPSCHP